MYHAVFRIVALSFFVLIAACPGHKIESQLKRAEELIGTRKFDEAILVYKSVISKYPRDEKVSAAHLKLGDLYHYTLNKPEDALLSYKKVMEEWPFSEAAPEAALKRANIFSSSGNGRGAIEEYEWILKYAPGFSGRFKAWLGLAEEYLKMGDSYQAAGELEDILASDGLDEEVGSKALFYLGESYMFSGEYMKALQNFDALEKKYPEAPYIMDARLRIVECLEKLDRPEDAIVIQKRLVKMYPESDLVRRKAESLKKRGEKAEKPAIRGGGGGGAK